MLTLNS